MIGLLPTANHHSWDTGLTSVIGVVSILPVLVAMGPAYVNVSTSCMLMHARTAERHLVRASSLLSVRNESLLV